MSHTPGPWVGGLQISSSSGSKIIAHIQTKEKKLQGYSNTNGVNPCEAKANANLITAAPELLQALKSLIQVLPDDPDSYEDRSLYRQIEDAVNKAKSIITKATGENYGTLL